MPPKTSNKTLGGLWLDGDRVQHVPGIALRRAIFLYDFRALRWILAHPNQGGRIAVPALDRSLSVHDFVAMFPELMAGHSHPERFFEKLRWRLWTDLSGKAAMLRGQTDVLVAEAAAGNLGAIQAILHKTDSSEFSGVHVDWEQVMEAACVNGHRHVADWLKDTRESQLLEPVEATQKLLRQGEQHALVKLEEGSQVVPVGRIQAESDAYASTTHQDAADSMCVSVLTSHALMKHVGRFQEDPLDFVRRYERLVPELERLNDQARSACIGVLPRLAIVRGDLDALKKIFYASARTRGSTATYTNRILFFIFMSRLNMLEGHALSFQLTMHLAACEGRLEILQWLHSRSHKHPQEICCRPDTMAMAVRCGWADVVEWLHLNRPESEQSMSELAINDAAKWGHVDVLRVCSKYKLGKFTTTAVEYAACAGHLHVLRFLRSVNDSLE